MNGFAIINKKSGISSSDVVIKCRNALSKTLSQKIKCGHMGTLDPMADGVLIVAFCNATRLFDFFLTKKKKYIATFVFGEDRDTADATGAVIGYSDLPKYSSIIEVLPKFVGETLQVPPKYSAVNVNGRRAYDMARAGKEFDLKPKTVLIDNIYIKSCKLDGEFCKEITLEIACGSGTYIRSICTDIAKALGVCSYMSALTRSVCGDFTLADSVLLEDFLANPSEYVKDIRLLIEKIMPIISADKNTYFPIRNGLEAEFLLKDGEYALEYDGKICFIAQVKEQKAKSICFLQEI